MIYFAATLLIFIDDGGGRPFLLYRMIFPVFAPPKADNDDSDVGGLKVPRT
jgi:hypothetical protein